MLSLAEHLIVRRCIGGLEQAMSIRPSQDCVQDVIVRALDVHDHHQIQLVVKAIAVTINGVLVHNVMNGRTVRDCRRDRNAWQAVWIIRAADRRACSRSTVRAAAANSARLKTSA